MKKFFLAFCLVAALTIPGCKTGMISVRAIQAPLEKVLDRHDKYVKADKNLSSLMKQIYLKTSELLRQLLKEAASD
jgi:hypothetical protein